MQDKDATVTVLAVLAVMVVSVVTATPLKLNSLFRRPDISDFPCVLGAFLLSVPRILGGCPARKARKIAKGKKARKSKKASKSEPISGKGMRRSTFQ